MGRYGTFGGGVSLVGGVRLVEEFVSPLLAKSFFSFFLEFGGGVLRYPVLSGSFLSDFLTGLILSLSAYCESLLTMR